MPQNQLIGILSDTHDQVHYLPSVIDFFNQRQVQLVIHCGDWVSPFTLQYYTKLQAPLYGIFGNNDGDKFLHQQVAHQLDLNLTIEDQLLVVEQFGKKIAVYHGTAPKLVEALVNCGDYDAVFYGHNHIAKVEQVGDVLVMNPGSLLDITFPTVKGASIGLYDAATHTGQIIPLDALKNESL